LLDIHLSSVLNVGSGRQTDLLTILAQLEVLAGRPIPRSFAPRRVGDIRHSQAYAGRAEWVLGWRAETAFSEGLAATWEWYRARA
jgi:UDP-glucose 4-epimerase